MPPGDSDFLVEIAKQYMFGNDFFSDFMRQTVAIIKNRINKYQDFIPVDYDDLIQEGFLQAFEAFDYWKRNGNKSGKGKASLYRWVWVYVESRFKGLAENNHVEPQENLEERLYKADEEDRLNTDTDLDKTNSDKTRQRKFIVNVNHLLSDTHKSVMATSRIPKDTARTLGLTRQRVIQMKNEALKIIKSKVKST